MSRVPKASAVLVTAARSSSAEALSALRASALPPADSISSGILQTLCRGLQDFARKLLVRYGTSHTDRTDQSAIGQDCTRSCTAPIHLVRVSNQSCEQLNVVPNFP